MGGARVFIIRFSGSLSVKVPPERWKRQLQHRHAVSCHSSVYMHMSECQRKNAIPSLTKEMNKVRKRILSPNSAENPERWSPVTTQDKPNEDANLNQGGTSKSLGGF